MDIQLLRDKDSFDAVLSLNINLEDFEENANNSLRIGRKKLNLPGFRNGMVPTGIAKKYLWESIVKDEIEKTLQKSIDDYLKDNNIDIIRPLLPIMSDKTIDFKNNQEFEFKYDIGIVEDVAIDTHSILKTIKDYDVKIDDKSLEEEIERIQMTYGERVQPEVIEDNDKVQIQLKFTELDLNKEILEGGISTQTFKSFGELQDSLKDIIKGKEKESEINIDIDKIFKNRKEFAKLLNIEKLTSEDANSDFKIKVSGIFHQKKAELNEELFMKVSQGKAKNEEEFKKTVEEMVSNVYINHSKNLRYDDIHNKLLESVQIKLPNKFLDKLFDEEYREKIKDLTDANLEEEKSAYVKRIKWTLIINKLSAKFKIEIEEKEIVEEAYFFIGSSYMQYGVPQPKRDEMTKIIKNYLKEPPNALNMKERVMVNKVFDYLNNEINFEKEEITVEKFNKIKQDKK